MRNSFAVDHRRSIESSFRATTGLSGVPRGKPEATSGRYKKLTLSEMFLTFQLDFYIDPVFDVGTKTEVFQRSNEERNNDFFS